jgi:fatty acid desaturase/SAM-dependent methyltransferase
MHQLPEEDILVPVQLRGILTADEVKAYRQPVSWRQIVDFGLVWLQILLGITVFTWSPGILSYVASVLLIGGGQHGLGLVAHEFMHYNVIPRNRRLNDFLGAWLFAAPAGIPYALVRQRHFLHHRYYSTDRDTKVMYRRDIQGFKFWIEVIKKLTMFEFLHHVFLVRRFIKSESNTSESAGPALFELMPPPLVVTQAIIFAALWPIHPLAYFFLYLGPLLTVHAVLHSFRAITEHQPPRSLGGNSNSQYFLGTAGPFVRTVTSNLFERLFICKINFGYHVEHHLWPQINYQFLPAVHRRLLEHNVFSDPRFGLESSFIVSIFKLAHQDKQDDGNWYARPVAHGISKQDVPLCPLCDSPRKDLLYEVQEHEYDNTTDDRFHMVECLECGAWYLDPRPADSELGTIYPPNYYSNVLEPTAAGSHEEAEGLAHRLRLRLFERRIRPVLKHLRWTPQTKWLDIGCGFGPALESIYQIHGTRGVGVDMSERAVAICRQRGFEAFAARIEDFTPPPGTRFHFIHSSHLIEHVASPLAYLQKVYDLLEPGGVTVFVTPNTGTWESRFFGRHWGGLHAPRHWVLFNPASAVRAARRVGFEHVETTFSTNSQFWIWSLHSLLRQWLPRKVSDALFPSDHRFVKSGMRMVLSNGLFTCVDIATTLLTGQSSNMAVVLRKPGETSHTNANG